MASTPSTITSGSRFLYRGGEQRYNKLKNDCNINISKTLDPSKLTFPVADLFERSCLLFLLSLAFPYHSDMLYEFYANLHIHDQHAGFTSRVFYTTIEFTKEEIAQILQVTCTGPSAHLSSSDPRTRWSPINQVIRNTNLDSHSQRVKDLVLNARVIQHIIRHTLLAKAGDRTKITPLLSMTTYYIMTDTSFDVADLIIRYFQNIAQSREPGSKKNVNIGLGHIVAFLIHQKYQLEAPVDPDIKPTFFTNHSFHTLYSGKRPRDEEEDDDEPPTQTQGEPSWTSRPGSYEDLAARFDTLQTSMDGHFTDISRQLTDHGDRIQRIEQRQEEQYQWLQSHYPQGPPPDEGPSYF